MFASFLLGSQRCSALQAWKDPMHGNEHGTSMLVYKCTVLTIRDFEQEIGLRPGTLIKRFKDRLHGLCSSPFVQHITLLTLGNQKILQALDVINEEAKSNT